MAELMEVEERYLPGVLREICGLVGLHDTLKIVQHFGGTRLYIRQQFDPTHPLVALIGHAQATKLWTLKSGDVDIPKAEIAIKAVRDKRIRQERIGGIELARLAIKYHLTERQISNICRGVTDDRQMPLL